MEMFFDKPSERNPVNIYRVLGRMRQVAQSGLAKHIRFNECYDPLLPLVCGNFDKLVKVLLNLVKNAAEAAISINGEIALSAAFRQGFPLLVSSDQNKVCLPLEVGVQDNSLGVSEDIKPYLFDAFVTNKANGSRLGLALVAE